MKILITGGAGYIGSILTKSLVNQGHRVTVLDKLFFGQEPLADLVEKPNFKLIKGDIRERRLLEKVIPGHQAVVHLAAIVGDPACALDADLTFEVNFKGTVLVAEIAKRFGLDKFVFASTCSVYGANQKIVSEVSELNPISLYAQTRLYGEKGLQALEEKSFRPVILRFGTVYGASPRMRFDLVVNYLTQKLYRENEISIFGGEQWRPLIYVKDAAAALERALTTDEEKTAGQIFNVGLNEHNHKLKDLIPIFQELNQGAKVNLVKEMEDKRSYQVNFDKIKNVLGFIPAHDVKFGIKEMLNLLDSGVFQDLDQAKYYNHKIIAHAQKF